MPIISFEDWKSKNKKRSKNSETLELEDYGYKLCLLISESASSSKGDASALSLYWSELESVLSKLAVGQCYYYISAFFDYMNYDSESYSTNMDSYFGEIEAMSDRVEPSSHNEADPSSGEDEPSPNWWIENIFWVFSPPFIGQYNILSALAFKHWPNCMMGWVFSALDCTETSEYNSELCLDLLERALSLDEDHPIANYVYASVLAEQKQYPSAYYYYTKACECEYYSNDPLFCYDYALCAQNSNREKKAIELFGICLEIDDSMPFARANLARLFIESGDYSDAKQLLGEAILSGVDGSLPYRLMVELLEKKDEIKACIDYIYDHLNKLGTQYAVFAEYLNRKLEIKNNPNMCNPMERPPLPLDFDSEKDDKNAIEYVEYSVENKSFALETNASVFHGRRGYGKRYSVGMVGRIDLVLSSSNSLIAIQEFSGILQARDAYAFLQKVELLKEETGKSVSSILISDELSPAILDQIDYLKTNKIEFYRFDEKLEKHASKPE